MQTFQSRFGHHPCDRETYFALKRLRHLWLRTLYRKAAWDRWDRKEPQNRFIRKKLRNSKKQCVGYEPTTIPIKEPKVPDFCVDANMWINSLYFEAKQPKSTPEEVKPLKAMVRKGGWKFEPVSEEETIKMIFDSLAKLSVWYEENGVSPKWSEKEKRIVEQNSNV